MRLWTVHPRYLDAKGLVAAWREALLAQKVLAGGTKGYRYHPQLIRFQVQRDPRAALAAFLTGLAEEAQRRGYRFDAGKISRPWFRGSASGACRIEPAFAGIALARHRHRGFRQTDAPSTNS